MKKYFFLLFLKNITLFSANDYKKNPYEGLISSSIIIQNRLNPSFALKATRSPHTTHATHQNTEFILTQRINQFETQLNQLRDEYTELSFKNQHNKAFPENEQTRLEFIESQEIIFKKLDTIRKTILEHVFCLLNTKKYLQIYQSKK